MRAAILTPEEIINDEINSYNPYIWEKNINNYLKYKNVTFFKVAKGNGYEYDRFYVIYTLPEGLTLLQSVSYSSSITAGGFYEYLISYNFELISEGNDVKVIPIPTGEAVIERIPLRFENTEGCLNTSKEARLYMINRSQKLNAIFSKLYL